VYWKECLCKLGVNVLYIVFYNTTIVKMELKGYTKGGFLCFIV